MSQTTPNMNLTYPEYNDPEFTWATLLNALEQRLISHDHNITLKKGVSVNISSLITNNNIFFTPDNALIIGCLSFSAQTVTPINKSIYVKDVDIYFKDGLGREIQLTSGGQLNQLTAAGGGFTGDFVASGASVDYLANDYIFIGSPSQTIPDFSTIVTNNIQTENLSLPFVNDTTVLNINNEGRFNDATFGFTLNAHNVNRLMGYGPLVITGAWPVWANINAEQGFAYSNYAGQIISNYLGTVQQRATGPSGVNLLYETGFMCKEYRMQAWDDGISPAASLRCGMVETFANGSDESPALVFNTGLELPYTFGIWGCYGTDFSLNKGTPLVVNQSTVANNYSAIVNMKDGVSRNVSNVDSGFLFFNAIAV